MAIDKSKLELDFDAALAAANNRFQIMARFYKKVIKPVAKSERKQAQLNLPFVKAKRLLRKEEALLSDKYRQQLADLLAHNEMVEKVYKMKQELQQVWKKRSASSDELLKAMQAWCKEAEESGIRALEEFAQSLRQYSTKLA